MSETLDDRAVLTFQVRGGATYAYHGDEYVFRVTKAPGETDVDLLRMAYNSGRKNALPQWKPGENALGEQMFNADQRDATGWNDKPEPDRLAQDGEGVAPAEDLEDQTLWEEPWLMAPQPAGPRFGERLRDWMKRRRLGLSTTSTLEALAAEIDADRSKEVQEFLGQIDRTALRHYEEVQSERAKAVQDLRRRIEEAVARLRTSPVVWENQGDFVRRKTLDVVDCCSLLAEIFGERPDIVSNTAYCGRCGTVLAEGGACPATHLVTVRKEDCEPLLVPEDRLDDFAEAGWFPEAPL